MALAGGTDAANETETAKNIIIGVDLVGAAIERGLMANFFKRLQ